MTLEKAVQVLSWENSQFPKSINPDFTEALELGIEALKWRKEAEEKRWLGYLKPLPGETEED